MIRCQRKIAYRTARVITMIVGIAVSCAVGTAGAQTKPPIPIIGDGQQRLDKPVLDIGTVRFLTSGDFPPFNFLDPTGQLVGYNVDLAEAICRQLGTKCSIQMRPFEDLVPGLEQRRGDAIIAGLQPDRAGTAGLLASAAYLGMPARFVAAKSAAPAPTPEGLEKQWISVVSGSAHEAYVLDHFPRSRVVAYPDAGAARDALREGTVTAHFGDALGLSYWLAGEASRGCCGFAGEPYHDAGYFGSGLRIVVGKGDGKLRRAMDWALDRLLQEGTLGELYLRWFPNGYY